METKEEQIQIERKTKEAVLEDSFKVGTIKSTKTESDKGTGIVVKYVFNCTDEESNIAAVSVTARENQKLEFRQGDTVEIKILKNQQRLE